MKMSINFYGVCLETLRGAGKRGAAQERCQNKIPHFSLFVFSGRNICSCTFSPEASRRWKFLQLRWFNIIMHVKTLPHIFLSTSFFSPIFNLNKLIFISFLGKKLVFQELYHDIEMFYRLNNPFWDDFHSEFFPFMLQVK